AGVLAAKGILAVDLPERSPSKASWKGNIAVTDFAALDKPTASDLLRWKRLTLDDVDVKAEPFRLAIGRVGAEDYYARAIVYQDGTLNLTQLLTPEKGLEPSANAQTAVAPPADDPLPITIGKIELARGNVNYSD